MATKDYKSFVDALNLNIVTAILTDIATEAINETIKTRDKALASISEAEKILDAAEESNNETQEAFRRCINAKEILAPDIKNLETAESKLRLAKNKALQKDNKAFLDTIELGKETCDLAYNAKSGLDGKRKYYKNTRSARVEKATSAFFGAVFVMILVGLACSPVGGFAGCTISSIIQYDYSKFGLFKWILSSSAITVVLFTIVGMVNGIVEAVEVLNTYVDMK